MKKLVFAAAAMVLAMAACGGDDGATVRDLGGSASSGSGSGSGSGSASGSVAASGSASASGIAECVETGSASASAAEVHVALDEWSVVPEEESVAAGPVLFEAINEGEDAHELVVVKADDAGSLPLNNDGIVDEASLEEGAFIGEVEAFPAGEECKGTFELTAGNYVLFCNIYEASEDENHYANGMVTEFTVTE